MLNASTMELLEDRRIYFLCPGCNEPFIVGHDEEEPPLVVDCLDSIYGIECANCGWRATIAIDVIDGGVKQP